MNELSSRARQLIALARHQDDPNVADQNRVGQALAAALREAQRALRSGDPNRAISLVELQDRQFPMGTLTQERAATRVFALCSVGQVAQARRLARAFTRRWPRSPMLTRVQNSCGAP